MCCADGAGRPQTVPGLGTFEVNRERARIEAAHVYTRFLVREFVSVWPRVSMPW